MNAPSPAIRSEDMWETPPSSHSGERCLRRVRTSVGLVAIVALTVAYWASPARATSPPPPVQHQTAVAQGEAGNDVFLNTHSETGVYAASGQLGHGTFSFDGTFSDT